MPCFCTADTLRLFIRNVTKVDLLTITRYGTPNRQLTRLRNFSSTRTIRIQQSVARRTSVSESISSSNQEALEGVSTEPHQAPASLKPWAQDSILAQMQISNGGFADSQSAFVELSPESIDFLAVESVMQTHLVGDDKVVAELTPNTSVGGSSKAGQASRTTFRRTKVQNTSLAIHFSAPRASLRTSSPRDTRPNPKKSTDQVAQKGWTPPKRELWQIQKAALKEKFPEGWMPAKRLSPDALAGIRALHAQMPARYTTEVLADNFKVSPEAIRRILKSKWRPDSEEESDRERRWVKRGEEVWSRKAELGLKPPRRWRDLGIGRGKPEWKKRRSAPMLPALVTTARRRGVNHGFADKADSDSLADRIL